MSVKIYHLTDRKILFLRCEFTSDGIPIKISLGHFQFSRYYSAPIRMCKTNIKLKTPTISTIVKVVELLELSHCLCYSDVGKQFGGFWLLNTLLLYDLAMLLIDINSKYMKRFVHKYL